MIKDFFKKIYFNIEAKFLTIRLKIEFWAGQFDSKKSLIQRSFLTEIFISILYLFENEPIQMHMT